MEPVGVKVEPVGVKVDSSFPWRTLAPALEHLVSVPLVLFQHCSSQTALLPEPSLSPVNTSQMARGSL